MIRPEARYNINRCFPVKPTAHGSCSSTSPDSSRFRAQHVAVYKNGILILESPFASAGKLQLRRCVGRLGALVRALPNQNDPAVGHHWIQLSIRTQWLFAKCLHARQRMLVLPYIFDASQHHWSAQAKACSALGGLLLCLGSVSQQCTLSWSMCKTPICTSVSGEMELCSRMSAAMVWPCSKRAAHDQSLKAACQPTGTGISQAAMRIIVKAHHLLHADGGVRVVQPLLRLLLQLAGSLICHHTGYLHAWAQTDQIVVCPWLRTGVATCRQSSSLTSRTSSHTGHLSLSDQLTHDGQRWLQPIHHK